MAGFKSRVSPAAEEMMVNKSNRDKKTAMMGKKISELINTTYTRRKQLIRSRKSWVKLPTCIVTEDPIASSRLPGYTVPRDPIA